MENQYKEYRQAMQHFTQSLLRAGVGLGLVPMSVIKVLPEESQKNFKDAGHQFACGMAELAHGVAHTIDQMAK